MNETELTVADNLVVSMEYLLRLDDGEEIDRSEEAPLQFLQGQGQIIPGLERALYGMRIGDEKDVVVAPADGYGERDPENLETMPRDAFPQDLDLVVGMGLQFRDKQSGEAFRGYVVELQPDSVVLDFNHPLAGDTLHFHIKIAGLRAATAEELSHGHVHEPGHTH
ncbi:MAG: peptidylprolyl isomerase [Anaerolineae bacterium]